MSNQLLEEYLRGLGFAVETSQDSSGAPYLVVRHVTIPAGSLAGRSCDIALARCQTVPYVCPPAIHTRPALVPMDTVGPLKTQASSLGAEWQYWSRRFDRSPSPQRVWAHVLTVLPEV
ncbi:MAG TPA: E2/UBC family protein [Pseudonocardiaceae bacterium]|nr:E2/UBC family protein [Pseudonocardiaceae bacterium]